MDRFVFRFDFLFGVCPSCRVVMARTKSSANLACTESSGLASPRSRRTWIRFTSFSSAARVTLSWFRICGLSHGLVGQASLTQRRPIERLWRRSKRRLAGGVFVDRIRSSGTAASRRQCDAWSGSIRKSGSALIPWEELTCGRRHADATPQLPRPSLSPKHQFGGVVLDRREPFRRDDLPSDSAKSAAIDRRDALPARPAERVCNRNCPCVVICSCAAMAADTYRVKTASCTEASSCQREDSFASIPRFANVNR
jgi:hypothetical protein